MLRPICYLFAAFLTSAFTMANDHLPKNEITMNRATLVEYREGGPVFLQTWVVKRMVENLLLANGKKSTTTSCRLENKRAVSNENLQNVLSALEQDGLKLEVRKVKNLPHNAKGGNFTFYGTAVKSQEAPNLPITSIKLRIRIYILKDQKMVKRSVGSEKTAFLELKIKNPFPDYPLSVHKYRLILPDEDILYFISADTSNQAKLFKVIDELTARAHGRDGENGEASLIDAMFREIKVLTVAEPNFIKPMLAITYWRISKKFDETYQISCHKRRKEKERETDTRTYEITIDRDIMGLIPDFSDDIDAINIEKYFSKKRQRNYLIARYPKEARIVEFKQPNAVGYEGPGTFRDPANMTEVQRKLWQALVRDLQTLALKKTMPDHGKFFHFKQFIRINEGLAREGEETILRRRLKRKHHSLSPRHLGEAESSRRRGVDLPRDDD